MRIVCISDTHEMHRDLELLSGDLLLHAGDFSFAQNQKPLALLRDFNDWLGGLPYRYKVIIPGNHDPVLAQPRHRSLITNAKLLVDSGVVIEGIRIWGSPLTPLPSGAFTCGDAEERKRHWARIPMDTDILITHDPAYGILDGAPNSGEHEGDPELLEAVLRVKPTLHVCGHVHAGYGRERGRHTYHVNAALYELGGLENNPVVLDWEALKKNVR